MKRIAGITLVVALAGCATQRGPDPNYIAYITAQQAMHATSMASKKPMVELQSNGQPITGLTALRVYAPDVHGGGGPQLATFQPAPDPWMQIASQALGIVGPVAGIFANGWAARGLASAVGAAVNATASSGFNAMTAQGIAGFNAASNLGVAGFNATQGIAGFIQAPQPNITLSGQGVVGSGSYTGPNSGSNSGNSGTIGNENQSPKATESYNTTNNPTTCKTANGQPC